MRNLPRSGPRSRNQPSAVSDDGHRLVVVVVVPGQGQGPIDVARLTATASALLLWLNFVVLPLLVVLRELQGRGPRSQQPRGLHVMPGGQVGQRNVEHVVQLEHVVHQLIHVFLPQASFRGAQPDPPIVVEQRLQELVDLSGLAREAHVEGPQQSDVFVVVVEDKLGHDLCGTRGTRSFQRRDRENANERGSGDGWESREVELV